jgi:hypothetical protein
MYFNLRNIFTTFIFINKAHAYLKMNFDQKKIEQQNINYSAT